MNPNVSEEEVSIINEGDGARAKKARVSSQMRS